ncbi:MAG: 6,7-dimethyl-8-ribityllumazine synthase [bacterium]
MHGQINGNLDAKGIKAAIIVSRFNGNITENLLKGAVDALKRNGAEEKNIDVFRVPGAYEIPQLANKILNKNRENYQAVICLGAVIRGATPHFEYISAEVSRGVGRIALKYNIPVTFGILTTDTVEQAVERSGNKSGNKGWDAALSAIEMVSLFNQI